MLCTDLQTFNFKPVAGMQVRVAKKNGWRKKQQ